MLLTNQNGDIFSCILLGLIVYGSIYKCFNDYLLQNADIYKGSLILPYFDLINNYFDWLVKRYPDVSPTR